MAEEKTGYSANPDYESVTTDDLNNRRIHDSTGKYLATLDGNDDSQKVADAITDRRSNSDVIVPAPDFNLDWQSQVDLPIETEFSIRTVGMPTIDVASGYSDNFVVRVPPNTSPSNRGFLDSFRVRDDNDLLDFAIKINDSQHWAINRWLALSSLIEFSGPNSDCQRNHVFNSSSVDGTGPNIHCGPSAPANEFHSPWVLEPTDTGQTGIHVEAGKNAVHNYDARVSNAFKASTNADDYYVQFKWLDGSITKTPVKEEDDVQGRVVGIGNDRLFAKSQIINPQTTVAEQAVEHAPSRSRTRGMVDVFEPVKRSHPAAASLSKFDLNDASTGAGTVAVTDLNNLFPIHQDPGTTSVGDRSVVDHGGTWVQPENNMAKLFVPLRPSGSSAVSNVLVRLGIREDSNNFAELVYDPSDSLSGGTFGSVSNTSNWNFRLVTQGTERGTTDLGVSPSGATTQVMGVSRLDNSATADWHAYVDTDQTTISNGGTKFNGLAQFRSVVETRDTNSNRAWDWEQTGKAPKYIFA
jgi:hypothetical protein